MGTIGTHGLNAPYKSYIISKFAVFSAIYTSQFHVQFGGTVAEASLMVMARWPYSQMTEPFEGSVD